MEFEYHISYHRITVDTCMALITSHRNYQCLHNLITGDEVSSIRGSVNGWELDKQVKQRSKTTFIQERLC